MISTFPVLPVRVSRIPMSGGSVSSRITHEWRGGNCRVAAVCKSWTAALRVINAWVMGSSVLVGTARATLVWRGWFSFAIILMLVLLIRLCQLD